MKSRQKNGRDSRSRETDGGEKIAVTTRYTLQIKTVEIKTQQKTVDCE